MLPSIDNSQKQEYLTMLDKLEEKLGDIEQVADVTGVSSRSFWNHRNGVGNVSTQSYDKVEEAYTVLVGDEEQEEEKERVDVTPPAEAHHLTNGNGSHTPAEDGEPLLETLEKAATHLREARGLMREAQSEYAEYERLMAIAYNKANPLVAAGIKATVEDLDAMHRVLEGVLV